MYLSSSICHIHWKDMKQQDSNSTKCIWHSDLGVCVCVCALAHAGDRFTDLCMLSMCSTTPRSWFLRPFSSKRKQCWYPRPEGDLRPGTPKELGPAPCPKSNRKKSNDEVGKGVLISIAYARKTWGLAGILSPILGATDMSFRFKWE
jgi:hypothetical protein